MIETDRLVAPEPTPNEDVQDRAIRPRTLADYIGQAAVREQMGIFVAAARARKEALDHTLIFGPPGLGKTTLAHIVANEMGVSLKSTSGPVLEKAGDLAALLTNLEPHDVLFIDEIHRLSPHVEEVLYPAMEDFQLDIMIGEGPAARSIKLDLPPFTLVGATTRAGLLTSPLRDRFGIVQRLEFYSVDELATIVARSGRILGIEMEAAGAKEIARRARGTPRIANRLLRRVRDFTEVRHNGEITLGIADAALNLLSVDQLGFYYMDRRLLLTLIEKFDGGPVGVDSLSAAIGEERGTIEDVLEPFLIQQGYVLRTPRGRMATRAAYLHFGLRAPAVPQPSLDLLTQGEGALMPGLSAQPAIAIPLRVYIEDTDAGGIVYYVNYLKYFERARTELMRALGFARAALPAAGGQFVVHAMQVEYLRPALLDDELLAEARIARPGRARLEFAQRILRGGEELCRGEVTVACVDPVTRRPCALPQPLRARLAQFESTCSEIPA